LQSHVLRRIRLLEELSQVRIDHSVATRHPFVLSVDQNL
jgi:hypothetical protein